MCSYQKILMGMMVPSPCEGAPICVLQAVVARCVTRLYQEYLPQSNLAPSSSDLRYEAMPLGQPAKRGSDLQSYLSILYLECLHKSMLPLQSEILLGQLQMPELPALILRSSSMLCSHEFGSPVLLKRPKLSNPVRIRPTSKLAPNSLPSAQVRRLKRN